MLPAWTDVYWNDITNWYFKKSSGADLFSFHQSEDSRRHLSNCTRRWSNFMLSIIYWEEVALLSKRWILLTKLFSQRRQQDKELFTQELGVFFKRFISPTFILTIRESMAVSRSWICLLISCLPSLSPATTSLKRPILFFRFRTLTNPSMLNHTNTHDS